MITFKPYHHTPTKAKALCYSGTMEDAEALEGLYKGKITLLFRGCFTGFIIVEGLEGRRRQAKPGDYLVDSPDFGLFVLDAALFHKYWKP